MTQTLIRSRPSCLLLCALLTTPALSGAQTAPSTQHLYDTLPTMTELYATRMAKFEAEPVVPGRIIFFGNSITQGGDWAKLTGDSTVLNRGIGGDVTFGLLHRLHDITVRQPSKLFILIGINDISRDIPDAVIAANPDKVEAAKAKPTLAGWFVGQVMKATGGKANPATVNALIKARLGIPEEG